LKAGGGGATAEPAFSHIRLAEFPDWDDGSDTRYELLGGVPVAMAPPAEAHRTLAARAMTRRDITGMTGLFHRATLRLTSDWPRGVRRRRPLI
jgi:hypothetical protein